MTALRGVRRMAAACVSPRRSEPARLSIPLPLEGKLLNLVSANEAASISES